VRATAGFLNLRQSNQSALTNKTGNFKIAAVFPKFSNQT
jgi:hypothetical protein